MRNNNNKNKSGCVSFLVIMIILLIVLMVAVIFFYSRYPNGFQEQLIKWRDEGISFIEQNTGVILGKKKVNESDNIEFLEDAIRWWREKR